MPASQLVSLTCAVLLLLGVAVGTSRLRDLRVARESVVVVVRAVVQLVAVAAVIKVVFGTPQLAPVYLSAMLAVAAWTSSRRLRTQGISGAFGASVLAIAAGAAATVTIVLVTRALPLDVRQIVPFTAQVIGGAMTATTLASLRLYDDTRASWHEVEGWLAIGAPPHVAVADLGRRASARALVPVLDQTRNVGLVVLPGAFVGLLLAGASPLEAGRLQLLVLVGLIAAQTVSAAIVTSMLGPIMGRSRPGPAVDLAAPAK